MPPKRLNENQLAKKKAAEKERKERKRMAKEDELAAAPSLGKHKTDRKAGKQERRDWAAMKASLVYDERGVGRALDGDWVCFPPAGPASGGALPAGSAEERARWMFLGFVEEGEDAREMLPGSSDEEAEVEDEEMGGLGGGEGRKDGGGEGVMGGGDALVGVEGGVAGLVLSGASVQ